MTPVYPKYYAGGRNCKWILRAEAGQRVQLRFLDISLREEVSQSSHPQCTDSIRVTERGRNLLSMCGESKQDIVLLSDANKLEVSVPIQYHPRILTLLVNLEKANFVSFATLNCYFVEGSLGNSKSRYIFPTWYSGGILAARLCHPA